MPKLTTMPSFPPIFGSAPPEWIQLLEPCHGRRHSEMLSLRSSRIRTVSTNSE
jgi:hypothetical protein